MNSKETNIKVTDIIKCFLLIPSLVWLLKTNIKVDSSGKRRTKIIFDRFLISTFIGNKKDKVLLIVDVMGIKYKNKIKKKKTKLVEIILFGDDKDNIIAVIMFIILKNKTDIFV